MIHSIRPPPYDRVSTVEKKRTIDDYNPPKRDDYKREPYKRTDDYKRDLDIPSSRHSGVTVGGNSGSGTVGSVGYDNRVNPITHRGVESSQTSNKDRYSERPSSDFRSSRGGGGNTSVGGSSALTDERDSRNKPRYLESQSDNRYQESRNTGSSGSWHNPSLPPVKVIFYKFTC